MFIFLEKFLGDQKASYNQELKFKLRVGQPGVVTEQDDLVIMAGGARVTKISVSLTDQNNPTPSIIVNTITLFKCIIILRLIFILSENIE